MKDQGRLPGNRTSDVKRNLSSYSLLLSSQVAFIIIVVQVIWASNCQWGFTRVQAHRPIPTEVHLYFIHLEKGQALA